MNRLNLLFLIPAALIGVSQYAIAAERPTILVGASKVDATPLHPVVLAGYGGRTAEHEGVDTPLWARSLVMGQDNPVTIVVLDNCGVPAPLVGQLVERLKSHGIARERLIVAATHTHNAPSLPGYAPVLWAGRTTAAQEQHVRQYGDYAVTKMEEAIISALEAREPMHLEWAQGHIAFGGNRRVLSRGKWTGFGLQRNGPVDHSLPVLAARDQQGTVKVVWANYACHCTTVGSRNRVCGDWAGFANEAIEEQFPGAVSLMTIGCGADVGPQPSGTLQIAQQHGRTIAREVTRLLSSPTCALSAAPRVATRQVRLPLAQLPPRAYWEEQRRRGGFHEQLALIVLGRLSAEGEIPSHVDFPLSVWTFEDQLVMIFLAGEVVVDYSVRLNRQLDWSRLWITAWANDMPGYIPSRRVLQEGGYEADFSQVYYAQPTRYDTAVEDTLVNAIMQLVDPRFRASPGQREAPFHRFPNSEQLAFDRLANWAAEPKSKEASAVLRKIRQLIPVAKPAVGKIMGNEYQQTEWYNFAGDFTERVLIRQEYPGAQFHWKLPQESTDAKSPRTVCFLGGTGWESEPRTEGFSLLIEGHDVLHFDVTRQPAIWKSDDENVELVYLPTWSSTVDSAGYFFLIFNKMRIDPTTIGVRSLGAGSKRWFAVDVEQDVPDKLRKLAAALQRAPEERESDANGR